MSSESGLSFEIRQKISKMMAVLREFREESKKEAERAKTPEKPEEIEMAVFWRKTYVRFTEPAEKWSDRRLYPIRPVASAPIDIIYPKRVQDW